VLLTVQPWVLLTVQPWVSLTVQPRGPQMDSQLGRSSGRLLAFHLALQ
jgi:hypothetical protein